MALAVADRVKETTTVVGTGAATLLGAVTGFQSFAAIGNGNTTYYCISGQTGSEWEVGIGTYTSAGTTLSRDTVLASSNAGALVSFSAGTKDVICTYPASKAVYEDANGNIQVNNVEAGYATVVSAAGTTVLTASSAYWQKISGTNTQTFTLPNATTLANGHTFVFDNDSTGAVTINDSSSTLVDSLNAGGLDYIFLEDNSTAAGVWGKYAWLPSNVNWGLTSADLGSTALTNVGAITTGGVFTASAGTSALPSIVTASGSTSGFYSSTANVIGLSISATSIGTFTSTGLNGMAVGATTASTGRFSTLAATGVFTASAGTAALPSIVTASGSTSGFYSSTANVIGLSISATSIGTFTSTGLNGMVIGATTTANGSFSALSATSNATGSVTAMAGGLTSVTAVAGSLTLATGGVTLASQTMTATAAWRVRAYGTYAAASSANVRALTMSCYWGTTALAAITTGNVLASTAQTTPWECEFTIAGSSTTAGWVTGVLFSGVTVAATSPLMNNATPASTTVTAGAQTLDFRVGQTGTATATDTINVHSVVIERIK